MRIEGNGEDRREDETRQGTVGPLDVSHGDPNDLSEFDASLPPMPADRVPPHHSGAVTPSVEPQTDAEIERAKNPLGYTATPPTEAEIDGSK